MFNITRIVRLTFFVIVLAIEGCAQVPPVKAPLLADGKSLKLVLLHSNDHHGRFWQNKRGEYGMAARKTLIDQIRMQQTSLGNRVLLLSGGDINTGVPESDLQDAEPDFLGMNIIGYDAMAIGNHEFDNPLEVLQKQQSWVDFPFLSANIYSKSNGKRLFKPYKLFAYDGLKIAVIGLTTDDTIRIGNPEYLDDIEFRSPIEEAMSLLPQLRSEADMVIALTHMGHYKNAEHGVNAAGDVALARAVPGIDIIIGGHSQEPVCMDDSGNYDQNFSAGKPCKPDQQNGTWIVQAFEWGKYLGRADLTLSKGGVTLDQYRLLPINLKVKKKDADGNTIKDSNGKSIRVYASKEITEDAALKAKLAPFQEKGQKGLSVVVGQSDGVLEGERSKVRFIPTNLGHLIAETQRSKVNADVAVMNSGGIRASLDAGNITYKDILTVQPFGNTVCVLTLSGADLLEYLSVAASKPVDTGAYAQFSGVNITIENKVLIKAIINDQVIDPHKQYRLALNSFLASGGDGYPKMDDRAGFVNTGFVDADVLREYIEAHTPLTTADYAPSNVIRN